MFAAEYEPAQLDRRRAPRSPVSLDAKVGLGGLGRALCKVVDASIYGVRLQTYSAMRKGQTIWLTLPRLGPRAADVIWADDFAAGCQVREPLAAHDFDLLLGRAAA